METILRAVAEREIELSAQEQEPWTPGLLAAIGKPMAVTPILGSGSV